MEVALSLTNLIDIFNEDLLLRRLSPKGHLKQDGKTVTRGAFKKRGGDFDKEISVFVRRLLNHPREILEPGREDWAIGQLVTRDVRDLGCAVEHDPQPNMYAHALILGEVDQELADRLAYLVEIIKKPGFLTGDPIE